jgi:hypothetical protein
MRGVGAGGGLPPPAGGGKGVLLRKILKLKMPNPTFWLYFYAKFSQKSITKMTFYTSKNKDKLSIQKS